MNGSFTLRRSRMEKLRLRQNPKEWPHRRPGRYGPRSVTRWKTRIHERENSMSKRPAIDLAALTSEAATPMTEASQRIAHPVSVPAVPPPVARHTEAPTKTANLQALAFKV